MMFQSTLDHVRPDADLDWVAHPVFAPSHFRSYSLC
jgi:hypothetical protein